AERRAGGVWVPLEGELLLPAGQVPSLDRQGACSAPPQPTVGLPASSLPHARRTVLAFAFLPGALRPFGASPLPHDSRTVLGREGAARFGRAPTEGARPTVDARREEGLSVGAEGHVENSLPKLVGEPLFARERVPHLDRAVAGAGRDVPAVGAERDAGDDAR